MREHGIESNALMCVYRLQQHLGGPREGLLPLRMNRAPVSPAGHKRQLKRAMRSYKYFLNGSGCCLYGTKEQIRNIPGRPGVSIM